MALQSNSNDDLVITLNAKIENHKAAHERSIEEFNMERKQLLTKIDELNKKLENRPVQVVKH